VEDQQEAPGLGLPGRRQRVLKFRLLAVDLDGTLLDATVGAPHEADKQAILSLARRGVPTTIVTGRLYSGTRDTALDIGATGAVACVDGCHLVDASTGADLHHGGLAGEDAARLREALERHGPSSFVFAHDQIVYDEQGARLLGYVRTWSRDQVRADRVTDHTSWSHERGITAVVSIGERSTIESIVAELESTMAGRAQVVSFPVRRSDAYRETWALMVRRAGYSKGTALHYLAAHYGVAVEEIVAVGDWLNDIPMFEVAGLSFAMGQAPEEVKKAATHELSADASTGGGIAEAAARAGLL
jgi:Cof subfamily protein (haloacid dehalogenase superfamily)